MGFYVLSGGGGKKSELFGSGHPLCGQKRDPWICGFVDFSAVSHTNWVLGAHGAS